MNRFAARLFVTLSASALVLTVCLISSSHGDGTSFRCQNVGSGQTQCFNCDFAYYQCDTQVAPPFKIGMCKSEPGFSCTSGTVVCGKGYDCNNGNPVTNCATYTTCRPF